MSNHFPSKWRDPSYDVSVTWPECPRKDWRVLLATPAGKRLRGCPRTRWRDYISELAWSRLGVEPAELSEIAVDREVFQVFLGMLSPPPSWGNKRVWKWMNTEPLDFQGFVVSKSFRAWDECNRSRCDGKHALPCFVIYNFLLACEISKQSIGKILLGNLFHITLHIIKP